MLLILLRVFHIGAGVFWVGGFLLFARFLFPTALALGPAAGPVMSHMTQVLKLPRALLSAAVVTILSGVLLYWHDSAGFEPAWMRSGPGVTFGLGAVFAITAFAIGLSVNAPTAQRMGALAGTIAGQGRPPSPEQAAEMGQLQRKLGVALRVVAALLFLATGAMAIARYV
jgi:hypothetical protein